MDNSKVPICWCGNNELLFFSDQYVRCKSCETIVSINALSKEELNVVDDEESFYGKHYWDRHMEEDLGLPNIQERSRTDLTDRCIHWVKYFLSLKTPPAKVVEIGSAHGGFVHFLRLAGFDAVGNELSPSIAEFANKTFDIPVLIGPVEDQNIPAKSLDAIALFDVLEHLPDPQKTMSCCLDLLKDDGVLLIQCPCYLEGSSYSSMFAENSAFLSQLKSDEHLFLYSKSSVAQLFGELGASFIEFLPAIFYQHDMFFAVSKKPIQFMHEKDVARVLESSPLGRIIQALIDMRFIKINLAKQVDALGVACEQRLSDVMLLAEIVKEKDCRISNLNQEIAMLVEAREQHLADADYLIRDIKEKDKSIGVLSAACKERLADVVALTAMVKEKDAFIDELSKQLESQKGSVKN